MVYDIERIVARLAPMCYYPSGFEHVRVLYREPLDLRKARILSSAPAMTDLVIDDSLPLLTNRQRDHPFFLTLDGGIDCSWGRAAWIQDLGLLHYAPAYDNLREVWLHDKNRELADAFALPALCGLQDERILPDIAQRLKENPVDEVNIGYYLALLSNFRSDAAVSIFRDCADVAISLYRAHELDVSPEQFKLHSRYGVNALSSVLSKIIFFLGYVNTDAARREMRELDRLFPNDGFVQQKLRLCEKTTRVIPPSGPIELVARKEFIGNHKPDIPF